METLNILEKKEEINWEYDKEADVLYISIGEPGKAVGLDVGEGVIVRYDEKKRDVVGLTIIGVKQRSLMALMGETRKSS
ncbi:MAG: hypothetical protein HW384_305 [Dehalococcoidia bacterium]|nr:hypothetical protein [Dehalococcoidia bacterium]